MFVQLRFNWERSCLLVIAWSFAIMNLAIGKSLRQNQTVSKNKFCPGEFGCECDEENLCNESKYLECIDGKCYCMNSMSRLFHDESRQCVSLVGTLCSSDSDLKCITNAACVNNYCACSEGYSANRQRMCAKTFQETCGPHECNLDKGLACKHGRCTCLDSFLKYSNTDQACVPTASEINTIHALIQRVGFTIAEEIVDRKIRKTINKGLNVLTLPLRLIPFVG